MTIMILGAGIMQAPAIRIAKEEGWKVICADGNKNAPAAGDVNLFLHIDLKDLAGLEKAASKIKEEEGLDGVFTAGTDFSASVAWIAEKLGLPGISYHSALNATDKIRMRSFFKEHNVASPNFVELSEDMNLNNEVSSLKFPLVVKPVDSMGARGVKKIADLSELENAVKNAIKYSKTDRAIIEEFIEGEEYSIDALVHHGEVTIHGLAIRHIFFPPYFIEMGHTMPALIDSEKKRAIEDEFKKGIKALGINNGAAKGDIIYSPEGPVIGEIAARLSGGYMSGWTFPMASNVESTKGAMQIALGLTPAPYDGSYQNVTAERAFLSIPGTVKSIENIEEAYETEFVKDLFLRIEEGDSVDFPVNNVEKCGNVISCHQMRDKAIKSAESACSKILITLDETDKRTGQFLYEERSWPDNAFKLNNFSNISFLEELEEGIDFNFEKQIFSDFKPVKLPDIHYEITLDWQGRKLIDVYNLILNITHMTESEKITDKKSQAFFWRSIIKGSIQGGLWFFDRFCKES
ncbi:MAG: ATP-grasp domain-containing protein [Spirochaetaceae bacterium]|jgi:biotin carboxylase|nr:ATP-grasp domain-containing protein [Spirochaetaceae bacterium]